VKLGVIGGTGVYDVDGIEGVVQEEIETPFGTPSDAFVCGELEGHQVVFLPRHGRGHRLLPSEINHRANIYAMKTLGVERVLSVSAVGSLKEEHRPRDIVLVDQYFDRTKESERHSFFGEGIVAHVSMSHPTCEYMRGVVAGSAGTVLAAMDDAPDTRVQNGGTYVNMQGPAFSTLAESETYRSRGFDVIGMTSLGEAKLCREAEICYQPMAMVTDYDCWHAEEGPVNVKMLLDHLHANAEFAKQVLRQIILDMSTESSCTCRDALGVAILTQPDHMPAETKAKLKPIIGKYVD